MVKAAAALIFAVFILAATCRPFASDDKVGASSFKTDDLVVTNTARVNGVTTVAGGITGLPVTSCIPGRALTGIATDGTATCTPFAAGGITNAAANNVITKSDGVNLQPSSLSDTGNQVTPGILTTSDQVVINANTGNNRVLSMNGPTAQTVPVTSAMSEIYVMTLTGTGHDTSGDVFGIVVRNNVSFDVTAAGNASGGGFFSSACSKSAGGNTLTCTGVEASAAGGDQNFSFNGTNGTLHNVGPASLGSTTVNGTLLATTNATIGSGTPSVFMPVNGIPTVSPGGLSGDSSNVMGHIQTIGATSTTLTFGAPTYTTLSHCMVTPSSGNGTIAVKVSISPTAPVFSCFNASTGVGANCPDLEYICLGH